jgi:hypothetical protein
MAEIRFGIRAVDRTNARAQTTLAERDAQADCLTGQDSMDPTAGAGAEDATDSDAFGSMTINYGRSRRHGRLAPAALNYR